MTFFNKKMHYILSKFCIKANIVFILAAKYVFQRLSFWLHSEIEFEIF